MRTVRIICDRCGESYQGNYLDVMTAPGTIGSATPRRIDLCYECSEEMIKWMQTYERKSGDAKKTT